VLRGWFSDGGRARLKFLYMIEGSKTAKIKSVKIFPLLAAASVFFLFYLSVRRPYLFGESNVLALLVLVVAGFIASQYETHFWAIMIAVFFWAGSAFPLAGPMSLFRWVVLGLGAFLGLAYYVRSSTKIPFNYLHLLGLFTVIAAFASAIVSVNPVITVLKALSLAALFVYASIGARVLWSRNPEPFVRKLVLMAEVLVYFLAICYAAGFEVWGSSNSLGLIMGCLCWPVLLWRFILPPSRHGSRRRFIALLVCGALLVLSLSRASLAAACLTSTFLLFGARRYRTLLLGVSLFAVILLSTFLVAPGRFQDASETLIYKKGDRGNVMDSRQKPWERSLRTFREHPWLGLGFGAADNSTDQRLTYATQGQLTRERGSSYLTMLETTGLLGTLPCALLILALIVEIWRTFLWLRRTGKVNQPAVVAAAIILAGLMNACFEDWMFAVGYYMSVIFWVLALSLRDWMACPVSPDVQPVTVAVQGSFALRGQ
jgi:O-antigen ligase